MTPTVAELVHTRGRAWRSPGVLFVALLPLAWFPLNLALHHCCEATYLRLASGETGALELSQAAFYVAAATSASLAARVLTRGGERGLARVEWSFAALALLFALEEIAWGQSLFDYTAPEWWRAINRQGDLTLHNLRGVHEVFGDTAMLASFVLAGAWICLPRSWRARGNGAPALLVPPALTTLYFLTHGLFILVLNVQDPLLGRRLLRVSQQEVFETVLAAGVFIVAELHRRASVAWART